LLAAMRTLNNSTNVAGRKFKMAGTLAALTLHKFNSGHLLLLV